MLYEIINILILALGAFFQAESELIKYRPWNCLFPKAQWYSWNIWNYSNKGKIIDWLMRYPFSFLKDGFHATKSFSLICIFISVYSYTQFFGNILIDVIFLYLIYGISFNFWYHQWYKIGKEDV